MISKESKVVILEKLSSGLTKKKNAEKNSEKLFTVPELSINQSQLETDFIANFKTVSGEVYVLEKKENLKDALTGLMGELGGGSVSCWNTDLLKSLELANEADTAEADIGITEADFAIADTGTLVLLSDFSKPRLVSALPPVHIAILERTNIVPDIHSLFLRITGSCSCISFITGPSRTADIELNLTLGVHGPGKVAVMMV